MAMSRRELIVLGASLAAAQTACTTTTPISGLDTYPLWRVQKDRSVVYLFADGGTTEVAWPSLRVEKALAESVVFWKETPDYTEADRAAYATRGVDPQRPLATWLTPSQLEKVSVAAADAGVAYTRLEPLKPWLAAVVLQQAYAARKAPALSTPDPLTTLEAKAKAAGKPVRTEFADAEATLVWTDSMSRETAAEYLMYMIDQQSVPTETWDHRKAAWARGDLRPLEAFVQEMKAGYPNLYPHMETDRNAKWPARFRTMLANDHATFVMIGAGHLVGPDSVLVQLKLAGLTVERI
ncbi:MAG: hypothetical protein B7Y90_02665 [Alphaproteobacteria bacterium 32-64-14]|nr:MAG: hypothetical protein B7Y90_02665 [Alphaproteobacteria bacterium 32-64-14]